MRNRLLTVICILSLAFGLVACGNKEDVKDTSAPNTETTTVETETSSQEETASQESTEVVKDETETETTPTTEENDVEVVASGVLTDATVEWEIIGTTLYVRGYGEIPDFNNFPVPSDNSNADLLRDWQPYYEVVEKIVIEEGITKIGNENFANFINTKEIVFADSVVEIGIRSCMGMGLENIDFNNVTKLNTQSFSTLRNIINLRIPGSISYIPDACFSWCDNLKEIYIENGVTTIKELAFTTQSGHWSCNIYLPESITDFPSDTFNHDTTIYGKSGSNAERLLNEFADEYNITVISE